MKIAIPIKPNGEISGHAGQARHWLIFEQSGDAQATASPPQRLELSKADTFHYCDDHAPHPLDGTDFLVTGSAGEGFIRRMKKRGTTVLLSGERNPEQAFATVIAGEPLPPTRFDITTTLCKLRDYFSHQPESTP